MAVLRYEVIVPAAGQSARFGRDKLLAQISDRTVIESAVAPFLADSNCQRILLMTGSNESSLRKLFANNAKVSIIRGSSDRQKTVLAGLEKIAADYVLIHDGARPFLNSVLLSKVLSALASGNACIPVIPSSDSVMRIVPGGLSAEYLNRSQLRLVQTPQGFRTDRLKMAFEIVSKDPQVAANVQGEEGSLYLAVFGPDALTLVEGDSANRKITYPGDLVSTL